MKGFSYILVALGLLTAAGLSACGSGLASACDDESCPAGQVCGEDGCVPLELPTAIGDLGRYTSVGVLSDGRRVVATYDESHGNLVLATEESDGSLDRRLIDGWRILEHQVVNVDSGRYASLAVGSDDTVHLAWYDVDGGALRYTAISGSGSWTLDTVDGEGAADRGRHASLALSDEGAVAIAYRDETARGIRYAWRDDAGSWQSEAVPGCASGSDCPSEEGEDYGEHLALVMIAGYPRIAFYDGLRGDLKMAARDESGQWQVEVLDGRDPSTGVDTGDVGRFVDVALDAQRRLGIAYFDATRGALRYLHAGGSVPSPVPVVVDDGVYWHEATGTMRNHKVGQHVALRFDSEGRAVMVYLDATRLKAKTAAVSGTAIIGPRDLDLPPGGFFDLAVAPDGALLGAYGPWIDGEAPRTRLSLFDVEVVAP